VFTEEDKVKEIYPTGYHGTDKQGRPIYIERLGNLDVAKIFTVTTEARMLKYYQFSYEFSMKVRYPACSEVAGRRITQGLTIMDLTGGGISSVNK
jgi:CRAL/TRIO domain